MKKEITVTAPATVANVACGFDILGFAIDLPEDQIKATLSRKKGVRLVALTGKKTGIPKIALKNTAAVAVQALLNDVAPDKGIDLKLHKGIAPGSGVGSSAASSAAALVAANELLGRPFTRSQLVPYAMQGEAIACGTAHADNVAPCLIGGFVLVRDYAPLDIISLHVPKNLHCVVIHPKIKLNTSDSRSILKRNVSLEKAIRQWANTAGLVAGLFKEDYKLIGSSLVDNVIEPLRAGLIPGFSEVKEAAMEAGALGCSISGSGPSSFALCASLNEGKKVAAAMQKCMKGIGLKNDVFISKINKTGAKVKK